MGGEHGPTRPGPGSPAWSVGADAELPQVWVVSAGTGPGEDTLSLGALTGTEHEAWKLLGRFALAFPGHCNEINQFDHHRSSSSATPSRGSIAAGERRRVFVVEERRSVEDGLFGFDVFDSEGAAQAYARTLKGSTQVHDVVTNEWCGWLRSAMGDRDD